MVEPSLNPAALPFSQDGRDFNTDTAFLGSEMASPPFENTNLLLHPGLYLHWRMPQELTRGNRDGSHPELPNRWLVCREHNHDKTVQRKYWIVESDGVPPATGSDAQLERTVLSDPQTVNGPHSRGLGRTVELKEWLAGLRERDTPGSLTAMGYSLRPQISHDEGAVGNPAFAAFFPDCRGVFSFCDRELEVLQTDQQISYVVSGWYSDPAKDPIGRGSTDGTPEPLEKTIDPEFLSKILARVKRLERDGKLQPGEQSSEDGVPDRKLYTGRIEIGKPSKHPTHHLKLALHDRDTARSRRMSERRGHAKVHAGTMIALGHTATEALSAFLAMKIAGKQHHERVEDQLEAILMASDLEHRLQDQHAKFLEGRHQKQFLASHGGTHWVIKDEPISSLPAQADGAKPPGVNLIPDASLTLLHSLNKLQRQIDTLQHRRTTLRRRMAADWSKYMLAAHPQPGGRDELPDPDVMAFRLRKDSLEPLKQVGETLGQLRTQRDELTSRIAATLPAVKPTDLSRLALKAVPGPRYWAPRDPVVVLEAPEGLHRHLPASDPKQTPPLVQTLSLPAASGWPLPADLASLTTLPHPTSEQRTTHEESTRPIFVEWDSQLTSLVHPDASGAGEFPIDGLTSRFAPAAAGPDLLVRTGKKQYPEDGSRFSGRSLVSAHASLVLHERLKDYLLRHFDNSWPEAPDTHNKLDSELQADRLNWLENPQKIQAAIAHLSASSGSLADTALKAWQIVRENKFLCLTLGGFNEALLMRRRATPLPVADPIGFPVYRDFAEEVRHVMGKLPGTAPEPLFAFHPIREGLLEIERLRLIDSFGRTYDVNFSKSDIILASPLRHGLPRKRPGGAMLPPRFVQPMRVDFRWLSAVHGQEEAHSHPDTSPLCGWLLPNRFDESIEVYAADGSGLGSIDVSGLWRSLPGEDHPIVPRDIPNLHLRRVVLQILEQSRDGRYQQAFLQTINAALEAIDPDSFAASPALSILVGRPLAVVRASVKFELQGEPAEDHSWPMLARRLVEEKHQLSRAFENVRIPFRIGEHGMFNDGVAGYWVEQDMGDSFEQDLFHAPQSDAPRHPRIASNHHTSLSAENPESQSLVLSRAPTDPPLRLTLLMDPRGTAHLTSGVLPVKQIRIDEHHFAAALRGMSVTFLSAPLLMSQNRTEVMLPGEPGYTWSFLDRTPDGWRATGPQDIKLPELGATFHPGLSLREGWLRLTPVETPTADTRNSAP